MQNFDLAPFQDWIHQIPPDWLISMRSALLQLNLFVHSLQILSQLDPITCPNASLTLHDSGSTVEIAAIMSYDNSIQTEVKSHRIVIAKKNGMNQNVSTVS